MKIHLRRRMQGWDPSTPLHVDLTAPVHGRRSKLVINGVDMSPWVHSATVHTAVNEATRLDVTFLRVDVNRST